MPTKGKFSAKIFSYYTLYFVLLYFLLGVLKVGLRDDVSFNYKFFSSFLIILAIWLFNGVLFKKYNLRPHQWREFGFYPIFISATLAYIFLRITKFYFPGLIYGMNFFAVLVLVAAFGETIILLLQYYIKYAKEIEDVQSYVDKKNIPGKKVAHHAKLLDNDTLENLKAIITTELGKKSLTWISRQVDLLSSDTLIYNTLTDSNIKLITHKNIECFINLRKINDHRFLNKFFEAVNEKLPFGACYVGVGETLEARYAKIAKNKFFVFKYIQFVWDFAFHRIAPKLPFIQSFYFPLTRGKNRAISKAEILGRLYSCGFEIVSYTTINSQFLFCVKKIKEASYDMMPTYGPFVALRRVAKNGKIIRVYKFRTMYPYSEYLQKYLVEQNGYDEVGKIRNDFRVTPWGKWFRKVWLDELPQLLNVAKGQLSIVGVRPLSATKFNELPKELQQERIKYKPGCIPPYVSLCLPDEEGNVEAEWIYLKSKRRNSLNTDIIYFFKAVYNILSGKIRSA